ncbi:MAG: twin-arginine translocation signal domain-containing protein, partial [Myxococcota bacterium]
MKRRRFLQRASAAGAGAAMGSVYTLLTEGAARCDPADDYKALVCVFLQGGLDNHDTLLPYDAPSYAEFSRIRRDLLRTYETPRSQDALLPLTTEAGQFGGRQFGLPPEMTGLKSLYDGGQAAIIANVGPLIEPVTRRSYEDRTARLPSRLFSHNDQQSTWMAGAPEGAQYGWAGLFADAMRDRNGAPEFSAITGGGNDLFVTGERTAPYQVPPSGAIEVEWVRQQEGPLQAVLREHLRSLPSSDRSLLEQDLGRAGRQAFDANARFNQASGDAPEFRTVFPESGIGGQLRAVSQSIAARRSLSVGRQV